MSDVKNPFSTMRERTVALDSIVAANTTEQAGSVLDWIIEHRDARLASGVAAAFNRGDFR